MYRGLRTSFIRLGTTNERYLLLPRSTRPSWWLEDPRPRWQFEIWKIPANRFKSVVVILFDASDVILSTWRVEISSKVHQNFIKKVESKGSRERSKRRSKYKSNGLLELSSLPFSLYFVSLDIGRGEFCFWLSSP